MKVKTKEDSMPAAYHIDLRRKVIQAIENGMRISEASRIFGVSRSKSQ